MFGLKLSSLLASGVLVLGGGAMALAQGGGPSDPPEDATNHASSTLETLDVVPETATDAVNGDLDEQGDEQGGDETGEENDATEFSEWVENLELEGCERGLTIAANAQNGPTEFDSENPAEAPSDHPAFTEGDCTEGDGDDTVTGTSQEETNRPDDAGEAGGRTTADEARGDADVEDSQSGADAAEQGQNNRPDDADEQGGRDRAPGRP